MLQLEIFLIADIFEFLFTSSFFKIYLVFEILEKILLFGTFYFRIILLGIVIIKLVKKLLIISNVTLLPIITNKYWLIKVVKIKKYETSILFQFLEI